MFIIDKVMSTVVSCCAIMNREAVLLWVLCLLAPVYVPTLGRYPFRSIEPKNPIYDPYKQRGYDTEIPQIF